MDQLKDILKQAIKYRFWIAVGLAALLPTIGYFVAKGAISDETTKKAGEIKSARDGVNKLGEVKNTSYTQVVKEKTESLSQNVDESWRLLYERQAPLLDWPASVNEYFPKWGRAKPSDVDLNEIQQATSFYIRDYPKYVTSVYKTIRPFDYEEGTGVIVAPPEEALLAPSTFTISDPPTLGKVWDAQEKLWLQRTVLDVITQVNKNAKDWPGAQVKQIVSLSVGNPNAQDQKSRVSGEQLEKSPEPLGEGETAEDTSTSADPMSEPGAGGGEGMMMAMQGYGVNSGGGSGGGGMSGPETGPIMHISGETASTQFRLFPIHIKVLVDQNYIPELLVAFQNSPMTIDVKEIRIQRPEQRVTKPVKGQQGGGYGGMMAGGYGAMMSGGSGMEMEGYGGMTLFGGNYGGGRMGGMMAGGEGYGGGMMQGYNSGMMSGGAGSTAKKSGVRIQPKKKDAAKDKDEETKEQAEPKYEIYDPYSDIVLIDVYGQARLYNAPPEPPPVETVTSESGTGDETGNATNPTPAAANPADEPKAETPEPKKADEPKAETPEPKKADEPKAETPEPKKADEPQR